MDCEEAWKAYEVKRIPFESMTKKELIDKVDEKFQGSKKIPASMKKNEIIDLLLPPVPRPNGQLSFEKLNDVESGSTNRWNFDLEAPKAKELYEEDLLDGEGNFVYSKEEMKKMLEVRNLPLSGTRKQMMIRLLRYHPDIRRADPKQRKAERFELFKKRPKNSNSIIRMLWDYIGVDINRFRRSGEDAIADDLMQIRPHVLQHLDNSFNYHILRRHDKDDFDFYFMNGLKHWQGFHMNCYYGERCPQKGEIVQGAVTVEALRKCMKCISKLVTLETLVIW
jgi:hypothetical protein